MITLSTAANMETRGEIAIILVDNPPVNAINVEVRKGIMEGLNAVSKDDSVKAVIIACAGRTFLAGADITEFGKEPQHPGLDLIFDLIENYRKPVIAAIHGSALGGGLETAMICHYRVAVPTATFGQPEVNLGLIPGIGGTQRLPRIIGVQKAIEMCAGGKQINAREALENGLIDAISEENLLDGATAFAKKLVHENHPLIKIRDKNDKIEEARNKPEIFAEARKAFARSDRGFDAPQAAIDAIETGVKKGIEVGLKNEREIFRKLIQGSQSAAMRYIFFAERECTKIPGLASDTPRVPVNKIGIVGAGTMGTGIAMSCANAGIPVTIMEINQKLLEKGLETCRENYKNSALKGRITHDEAEKRLSLINGTISLNDFADVDMVVEAVFENKNLKKEIFAKLDKICKDSVILATNTSALNITEIALATKRPESVIGLHFFSPANVMRLLEIVRTEKTADDIIATSISFGKRIKKIPVLVRECHGFVGNRMLFQRVNENKQMLLEGSTPQQIDKVLYDFGFPMGPFAVLDLVGLDVGWDKAASKGETLRDVLCEAGRFGQKTNAGYYDYKPGNRTPIPSQYVQEKINELAAKNNIKQRLISDEEILERSLYSVINEGAKILDEGIAIRPGDIDVIWVNGYGWPRYRGGPMFYADSIGLKKILDKIKAFEKTHGNTWRPSALLEKLVNEGKEFKDLHDRHG
ncbi:MAG: enoyl-CoA hydratase/isomerase family protein [Deltaproteobacteria bacterium]|nr:enoyl-CoA hydratase/isomerase family protein [Deltaproteobacteria bacterium]